MSRIVDNMIAYRILNMLVTPFDETDAYKLGIIDEKGKILKKANSLKTTEEKDAYSYLHRLVFNMKRIINKLPGGESKLRNIVAAYFLIKESYETGNRSTAQMQEKLDEMMRKMDNGLTLVEEEITVKSYLDIFEQVSGAPANATGAGVSTDQPVVHSRRGRKFATFNVPDTLFRRFERGKKKYKRWSEYLDLNNETEKAIYDFAKKNPKGVIILQSGENKKAIRFNRNGGGRWGKLSRKTNDMIVQVE